MEDNAAGRQQSGRRVTHLETGSVLGKCVTNVSSADPDLRCGSTSNATSELRDASFWILLSLSLLVCVFLGSQIAQDSWCSLK